MTIFDPENASVEPEKIVGYLLSVTHPSGKAKAAFFLRFGFAVENWKVFADSLILHVKSGSVVDFEESEYGCKWIVAGPVPTPDGRNPQICSVWINEPGKDFLRFVTAYPIE